MKNRIVLRAELEKTIAETGCTLSRLSELGGAAVGNLSASLRGDRCGLLRLNNWTHLRRCLASLKATTMICTSRNVFIKAG
ncbi:hypothetical protein P7H16_05150 [Paenibacillus larvae]|nr:hypothetical protein [Paenibacillus larvae]MDT2235796.1 hypothetical protein [Paenibacillus larvae]MDT2246490.1 hypothetical protein [Paenibacillus larvae]MDT2263208.1 hypothetical protein [Paenibacillus larvae]MDT2274640.1 hypothetical protein [Paenibacillus larvae]MDT2286476.1 hypothetical protein [Paenibacillus larvae]